MSAIKVLVADDSVVYRTQTRKALESMPFVEVVATVPNGKSALERLKQSPVDLLILDLEMPEMSGLQVLEALSHDKKKQHVLVFSSFSRKGADITFEALKLGASDFVTKPGPDHVQKNVDPAKVIQELLEPKIRALFSTRTPGISPASPTADEKKSSYPKIIWELFNPKILVIGSSTGGPNALESLLSFLKGPYRCPIVIAQHMPPVFTTALAERLGKCSGVVAQEAVAGVPLTENTITVAPGDFHLTLVEKEGQVRFQTDKSEPVNFVRPAVDPLFRSAAQIFKSRCLGIVLTGMGSDGREGARAIKESGGAVVIQNQESSVVFGMPGAVQSIGAFDYCMDIKAMSDLMRDKICRPHQLEKRAIQNG